MNQGFLSFNPSFSASLIFGLLSIRIILFISIHLDFLSRQV